MKNTAGMKTIYKGLKPLGIPRPLVDQLLPDWWEPSIADSPAGYQETALRLTRIFNLAPGSLLSGREAAFAPAKRQFKRRSSTSAEDVAAAASIATAAAGIIARCASTLPKVASLEPVTEIRKKLLAREAPWVGLDNLSEYCWEIGIPVIHLTLPRAVTPRMDGLVIDANGRPIIILTTERSKGFLLFDLAHELGHIACGHLEENSALIDIDLNSKDFGENAPVEEREADRYGLELLSGFPEGLAPPRRLSHPRLLVDWANQTAREYCVEPSHAILCYAKKHNDWPNAMAALKLRQIPQEKSDSFILKEKPHRYLDFSLVSDDEAEFLERLITAEDAESKAEPLGI